MYGYDIIDLDGEIDYADSKSLEQYILENASDPSASVVLNFERVPFMNSSALSLLVRIMQTLAERERKLFIMNLNSTVLGLLEMTGVKRYFNMIHSETVLTEKEKKKDLDNELELND